MTLFTFVLKNLARRRIRTALTCVGIAVAIGAVVALVGIASGFERNFIEVFEGRGVDLVVVEGGITEQLTSSLDEGLVPRIRELPGVAHATGMLLEVLAFEQEGLVGVMVQGWAPECVLFEHLRVSSGRTLQPGDQRQALLGSILARNLKKKVGDTIEIDREDFTIAGVFESFNIFENGSIVVPLAELQRVMLRPRQLTAIAVLTTATDVDKTAVVTRVCQEIESFSDDRGRRLRLTALPTRDYVSNTLQIRMAHAMAWVTSTIALVIGAIGMFNTMMTSVLERTREIGVLRALGWRQSRIVRLVLLEAVVLGLLGAVAGTLLAVLLIRGMAEVPSVGGFIQGDTSLWVIGQGFAMALIVGLLGGGYPAWAAARLLPTEALRHE
ncbi:MAG TPA: ABC transporter permease [Gemmatales bacterium]|nr:ABC transporter permease [Gemmatales bacterium]